MYNALIKPILFSMDAEKAHHFAAGSLRNMSKIPGIPALWRSMYSLKDSTLEREVFGLKFPNPVGLAAGFDKDAVMIDQLSCFGFGFVEIGTLTPKAQEGNPKPRLFRLKDDKALINRMGFNNMGLDAAVENLKKRKSKIIVGGNIGKNKVTPNQDAISDYLICLKALHAHVDYFTVNISSPNTPGLRELQDKEPLTALLREVISANKQTAVPRPVLLKIAPDLTLHQIDDILQIAADTGLDGLIATNTTIAREGLIATSEALQNIGTGGLSGQPLEARSTQIIEYIVKETRGNLPVIGVGGIMNADDAMRKLDVGASLIQLYTGFVYGGPGLPKRICRQIVNG